MKIKIKKKINKKKSKMSNKLETTESKLDKSEEKTFLSGKNMKLYNFTEETQKNNNDQKKIHDNLKLTKNFRASNETYTTNLYGNVTGVFNNYLILIAKT